MRQIKLSATVIAICSLLAISCENKLDLELNPKEGTAVNTIEATATFDLSARKNWIFVLDSHPYNCSVDNSLLHGTSPIGTPFSFEYDKELINKSPMVLFYPPTYAPSSAGISYIPDILDQSSIEKFTKCDPLRGTYTGGVSENLTGIKLYHYNALLNFKVSNVPGNARIRIKQVRDQIINPYQKPDDSNGYMAIVFPYNQFKEITLMIDTDTDSYEAVILKDLITPRQAMQSYSDGIGNSTVVNFTARIDETNELIIENLERKAMSREWPITQ